jgi:protein-S-isoprenylcysteine O-methyltransferase Ste14
MNAADETFRLILIAGAIIVFPVAIYHRLKAHSVNEKLDRWKEGPLILFTLRPIGIAVMAGLFTYMVNPARMAWSSMPLPVWLRWLGVGIAALGGMLFVWTFRNLGRNLTDTVVTRREHTLVTTGPYRWVRHPFYVAAALAMVGNALAAANWFLLGGGVLVFELMAIRTRIEEAELVARFGDAYRAYMDRTPRFLPRLR